MRCSNWPSKLAAFIEGRRFVPFAWSTNDCCTFAADWILILTGVDHAAEYRGTYSSALGAGRILAERGGLEAIAAAAGYTAIPPAFASRGDLVLFDMPDGPTLGVCAGKHSVFAGEAGAVSQPTANCRLAWRVE